MAKLLDRPAVEPQQTSTLEERYRKACEVFPGYRVELINARIVVNDVPTGAHNDIIALLLFQITNLLVEKDWRPWTNIKLFLGTQVDRFIPDLTIVPKKPKMWGDDEVYGDNTLLVVEVVSPSSVTDDYNIKPAAYAAAGVPLFLRIDPMKSVAALFSRPSDKGYEQETQVTLGTPLDFPEPWKLSIDTGKLIDSEPAEETTD